jgi:dipeptidyl aminopeptidase/acylaminoacyl peptidase
MNADGSDFHPISDPGPGAADFQPAWSPDGTEIAFIRSVNPDEWPWQIWLMRVDGSNLRRLTDPNANVQSAESWPAWSPDGTRIAYWSAWTGISVINRDGTGQYSLSAGIGDSPGGFVLTPSGPAWSPDGSKVLFGQDAHQYVIVNADGTGLAQGITTAMPQGTLQERWAWSKR